MVRHVEVKRDDRGNIGLVLLDLNYIGRADWVKIESLLRKSEKKVVDIDLADDGSSMHIYIPNRKVINRVIQCEVKKDECGNFGLYLLNLNSVELGKRIRIEKLLLNPDIKIDIDSADDDSCMRIRIM